MSKNISGVNTAADTFLAGFNKVTELANVISTEVVTANATGALTTGNGFVNGYFGSNTLVTSTLKGGNVTVNTGIDLVSNIAVNLNNITYGNSTANAITNSTIYSIANSTGRINVTPYSIIANNLIINTIGIEIGTINSTSNGVKSNSTTISIGNSSVNISSNSSVITFNGVATVNSTGANNAYYLGGVAAANYQLESGLAANVATMAANSANIASYVIANDGIVSNSTGVFVKSGTGTVVNSTGVHVNSNYIGTISSNNASYLGGVAAADYQLESGLASNVATLSANYATYVLANDGIVSNSTGVFVKAGTGTIVNATGVHVNTAYVSGSTVNNALYLDGIAAASYIQNTDSRVLSGNLNFTGANVYFTTGYFISTSNTTSNGIISNSSYISIGNSSVYTTVNTSVVNSSILTATSSVNVGSNIQLTTLNLKLGNSTINSTVNSLGLISSNSTLDGTYTIGSWKVGNSSINISSNSSVITFNGVATVNSTGANNSYYLGGIAAASYVQDTDSRILSGNLNFTGSNVYFNTGIYVGANVNLTTSRFNSGNSTVNSFMSDVAISISDTDDNTILNTTRLKIGNSTVNAAILKTSFTFQNSTISSVLTRNSLSIGNSTVNTVSNDTIIRISSDIGFGGPEYVSSNSSTIIFEYPASLPADIPTYSKINATNFSTSTANIYTGIYIGNSTVNTTINSTSFYKNSVSINPIGLQSFYVPANRMTSRTTSGAATGLVETNTYKVMLSSLDFDASTTEYAQFLWLPPVTWDGGSFDCEFVWSHTTSPAAANVVWAVQALARTDNTNPDGVDWGTAATVLDTGGTVNRQYKSGRTGAFTASGSTGSNCEIFFQIYRSAVAAGDDLAVDARLHGVKIYYTTNTAVET